MKAPHGLRPDLARVLDDPAVSEARSDPDAYYANHYASVVYGGIGGAIQRMFHRAIERSWRADDVFETVLEVGSANAEHLPFVAHQYARYVMLDSRESSIARRQSRPDQTRSSLLAMPKISSTCRANRATASCRCACSITSTTRTGL